MELNSKKNKFMAMIGGFLIFFATTIVAGAFDQNLQKIYALVAFVAVLILCILPKGGKLFKENTTPIFGIITAYVFWSGFSVFYALSSKTALFVYTQLILAYFIFMLVLAFIPASKKGFLIVYQGISLSTAILGIISISAASNGIIAGGFKKFMGIFTHSMDGFGYYEQGVRITGIFGNANTFSALVALSILISMALVIEKKKSNVAKGSISHLLPIFCLAVNAVTYLLLLSMGSMVMFAVSFIILFVLAQKEDKTGLLILAVESAILTLVFGVLITKFLLTSSFAVAFLLAANCVVLLAVDNFVGTKLDLYLSKNLNNAIFATAVPVVSIIIFVLVSFNLTGSVTLSADKPLMRAAYLNAGSYVIETVGSQQSGDLTAESVLMTVTSQNLDDLKVHRTPEIYSGTLKDAAFTVPEDSKILKITLYPQSESILLEKVNLVNTQTNETESLKLKYLLLPENVANRIQDLRANQNVIQRGVFFEDGIKLFKKSPIIGLGLDGFESNYKSVQNFDYTTRYVHNHYIQVLCDLGIIGFALFISLIVFALILLVKLFKISKSEKQASTLIMLPLLSACTFQMFGQATTDLTWSTGPFLVTAFALFGIFVKLESAKCRFESQDNGNFSMEHEAESTADAPKVPGAAVLRISVILFIGIFSVLLILNTYAHAKAASGNCSLEDVEGLIKLDKFESVDLKSTYIINVTSYGLTDKIDTANKYAASISKIPSIPVDVLVPYYFNTWQRGKLFQSADTSVQQYKSDPEKWQQLFRVFSDAAGLDRSNPVTVVMLMAEGEAPVKDSMLKYYKELQKRNSQALDTITLTPENNYFIGKLLGMEIENPADISPVLNYVSRTLYSSAYSVDADNNLIPDNMQVLSGKLSLDKAKDGKFTGGITAEPNTVADLNVYCVKGGEYRLNFEGISSAVDMSVTMGDKELPLQYDGGYAYVTISFAGANEESETPAKGSVDTVRFVLPNGGHISNLTLAK